MDCTFQPIFAPRERGCYYQNKEPLVPPSAASVPEATTPVLRIAVLEGPSAVQTSAPYCTPCSTNGTPHVCAAPHLAAHDAACDQTCAPDAFDAERVQHKRKAEARKPRRDQIRVLLQARRDVDLPLGGALLRRKHLRASEARHVTTGRHKYSARGSREQSGPICHGRSKIGAGFRTPAPLPPPHHVSVPPSTPPGRLARSSARAS